jgi:SAM-dependent methyltransferase
MTNPTLPHPAYPRAATYDTGWQVATMMGPNALWLTEAVTARMDLRPGMRVLDLGCGMATSSIFLAREFGVQVIAADLWIDATSNLARIREAGVGDRVFPVHAEAHALPFAAEAFDAIVSIDAYQYFGTSETYTAIARALLRPGGQLGIAVPGLTREIDAIPPALAPWWEPAFWSFHSAAWWASHLERTGPFTIGHAAPIPDGHADWRRWLEAVREIGAPPHYPPGLDEEIAMLEADGGDTLALVTVVARRDP